MLLNPPLIDLNITLQDGFQGEQVVIRVGDQQVYAQLEVRTKMLLGYADFIKVTVQQGQIVVGVDLPTRDISEKINLEIHDPLFLFISLVSSRIEYLIQNEPLGFM